MAFNIVTITAGDHAFDNNNQPHATKRPLLTHPSSITHSTSLACLKLRIYFSMNSAIASGFGPWGPWRWFADLVVQNQDRLF